MKIKLAALTVFILLLAVANNLNFNKKHYEGLLEADARGYYAYLPAIFIYKDVQFTFFDSVEAGGLYNKHFAYDYRFSTPTGTVNKYYLGTAVLQMPFFIVGHVFSKLFDEPQDGYSFWYFVWTQIGALIYGSLGLYLLMQVLNSELNSNQSIVLGLGALFGTNLFYYLVAEPGMSHVYTFFLVAATLYWMHKIKELFAIKNLIIFGLLIGLLTLIRPINGVLVSLCFAPIIWVKFQLNEHYKKLHLLIVSVFTAVLVFSAQLFWYFIATGEFWVYSYGSEGFNWFNPNIFNFLWSYKKGLFLYTPFYLLVFLGAYGSTRKKDYPRMGVFIALIVVVYVLASWWSWWYGGSFSQRVAIDFLPFVVWLSVPFVKEIQRKIQKIAAGTLLFLVIVLCQIQTYQYRYFIIHWENMTYELYWDNFLRVK